MKFLMLVCVEQDGADDTENDTQDGGSFPWLDDVIARGIRLDGDRLKSPRAAKTVLVRDGEVMVSPGPFGIKRTAVRPSGPVSCVRTAVSRFCPAAAATSSPRTMNPGSE